MNSIAIFTALPNVCRNPVAKAVERRRLQSWLTAITAEVYLREDGDECGGMLKSAAEAIGCAIKSIEGFDDPEDVGGLMVSSMGDLARMANNGAKWEARCADHLAEALDCAVQILCASDAEIKRKAWRWSRQFTEAA